MVETKTLVGLGTLVTIAAIIGGFVYFDSDQVYTCEVRGEMSYCFKLSAINDDGMQTRCYYNESSSRRYYRCDSGWELFNIDGVVNIPSNEGNGETPYYCSKVNDLIKECRSYDGDNLTIYRIKNE